MATDAPAVLSPGALAAVLDTGVDAIVHRESFYWDTPGRGIERVTWVPRADVTPSVACVKYGAGLEREALAQSALLDAAVDAVPTLIGCRQLPDGGVVLATRWVEGRTPDFSTEADLVAGCTMAAQFAAEWADRVRAYFGSGTPLPRRGVPAYLEPAWKWLLTHVRDVRWYEIRLARYAASVLEQDDLLRELDASLAADACREISAVASRLAHRICSTPLTLDPGDFARENALFGNDGRAYLLDFERVRIVPVVNWFERLGEDLRGQPAHSLLDVALRAFVDGWNATGVVPLGWEIFRGAHNSLRVWRHASELSGCLRDLVQGNLTYDARASAVRCARDLPKLFETAMTTL